ncbi:MAG: class I SAM-dependent methyltransferase [Dehalococcoidia bacterium]
MSQDLNSYTEANRTAWNQTAPVHAKARLDELIECFSQPGYSRLKQLEEDRLVNEVGVKGKDVVQPACNNARELLSIKNLGARRCVGFDISDGFIGQGRQIAAAGGIECELVRSSVYEIPAEYDNSFDLVYITIGALGWMPDIDQFFAIVARLLRPGGQLFIYEMHPILDMFESGEGTESLKLYYSYFRTEPYVDDDGLDYLTNTTYESAKSYWFHHKLSDIIGAVLKNGMTLTAFDEYDHDISNVFAHLENETIRPPLSYILIARKA